jgi:DNA mismatch repair ATPase MutS
MVEMNETCEILKQATENSLVILDELGRGTSTYDGYGIAYAVLYWLAVKKRCLGLFSTHYGLLPFEFEKLSPTPSIRLMKMDCLVDETKKEVVFLYKLKDGYSGQSYGMNVARMSGVPAHVVDEAERKATEMLGQKGWIGAVGQSMNAENSSVAFMTHSRNLLVKEDAHFIKEALHALQKNAGDEKAKQLLIQLWKNARARYA